MSKFVELGSGPTAIQNIGAWEAHAALGGHPELNPVEVTARKEGVPTSIVELWPLNGIHTDLTTGTTINVTSNDATANQTLRVEGLDADWNEQAVNVVLNGRTPVRVGALLGWTTIHKAYQVSSGVSPSQDVYFAVAGAAYTLGVPDTVGDVQSYIDYGSNAAIQTETGWFVVPAGHRFLLWQVAAYMNDAVGTARTAEITIFAAPLTLGATVGNPSWTPYRRIHELVVGTSGSARASEHWKFPHVFEELTRVSMRGAATAASTLTGEFDGLVVPRVR